MIDNILKMLPIDQLEKRIAKGLDASGKSILISVNEGNLVILSGERKDKVEGKTVFFDVEEVVKLTDLMK